MLHSYISQYAMQWWYHYRFVTPTIFSQKYHGAQVLQRITWYYKKWYSKVLFIRDIRRFKTLQINIRYNFPEFPYSRDKYIALRVWHQRAEQTYISLSQTDISTWFHLKHSHKGSLRWSLHLISHPTHTPGSERETHDPEMKLHADKSPPTEVQEFSGLMKKSCSPSREGPVRVLLRSLPSAGAPEQPHAGPWSQRRPQSQHGLHYYSKFI